MYPMFYTYVFFSFYCCFIIHNVPSCEKTNKNPSPPAEVRRPDRLRGVERVSVLERVILKETFLWVFSSDLMGF